MQPFNSGSIRRKLYKILDDAVVDDRDMRFFAELEQGRLDTAYIESEWYRLHSSTLEFKPGCLHVLKTTLNHFTIDWVQQRFPGIEVWGVWREPIDILASLVRNDFHRKWYAGAIEEIRPAIAGSDLLRERFLPFLDRARSDIQEAALLVAARTFFFFHHLPAGKSICYEEFCTHPAESLQPFMDCFGLSSFPFEPRREDLNLSGKPFEPGRSHREQLRSVDLAFAESLFETLRGLPR